MKNISKENQQHRNEQYRARVSARGELSWGGYLKGKQGTKCQRTNKGVVVQWRKGDREAERHFRQAKKLRDARTHCAYQYKNEVGKVHAVLCEQMIGEKATPRAARVRLRKRLIKYYRRAAGYLFS